MIQEQNKMIYYKAIRSGTARNNGFNGDIGHIVHLVAKNDYPSWETGICGVEPKGNGWYYPDNDPPVTCEKCIKKLNKLSLTKTTE